MPDPVGPPPQMALNIQPALQGPLVRLLHTEREMRIFGVTENELRTITAINAATAALFSLGTGCFGYLLNLQADLAFANKIPQQTQDMLNIVQPGLKWIGIVFYCLGILAWIYRGSFITTIKQESDPQLRAHARQIRRNRFVRAWTELWS